MWDRWKSIVRTFLWFLIVSHDFVVFPTKYPRFSIQNLWLNSCEYRSRYSSINFLLILSKFLHRTDQPTECGFKYKFNANRYISVASSNNDSLLVFRLFVNQFIFSAHLLFQLQIWGTINLNEVSCYRIYFANGSNKPNWFIHNNKKAEYSFALLRLTALLAHYRIQLFCCHQFQYSLSKHCQLIQLFHLFAPHFGLLSTCACI